MFPNPRKNLIRILQNAHAGEVGHAKVPDDERAWRAAAPQNADETHSSVAVDEVGAGRLLNSNIDGGRPMDI